MAKMLKHKEESKKAIYNGVKKLARAVKATLGPKGRNVMICKEFGSPSATKDGVSVAKEVSVPDRFENIGVEIVKQASLSTGEKAGDGTTTAIVLAENIFTEGLKLVVSGADPFQLKKGMDIAVETVINTLDKMAIQISKPEEITQIATISANNDETIGLMIAEAMEKVGRDGTITTEDAKSIDTTLRVTEGLLFDKGYLSPYFVNNSEKMECQLNNSHIFITDKKIIIC